MSTAQKVPPEAAPLEQREYQFTPKLSPMWALNLEQVLAVALFGCLYVVLNFVPLRSTDIWGHVMYGQWIIKHWAIPPADPWMPLAAGMQVVDTAWLSQVIFGAMEQAFGEESLSHLFAVVNLAVYIVWASLFYLQTRRVWLSLLCTGLLIFVGFSRLATIRPENFAVLCFAVIFLLIARAHMRAAQGHSPDHSNKPAFDSWTWCGVPVAFALWANLHGSFLVGLVVLGCFFAGRVVEVAWQSRNVSAVLRDAALRRWLFLLELAGAATLLNPYGLDLWIHTLQFSFNPNLPSILEWQPLVVFGTGGRPFAVSVVLLLFIWRQSQRPIRPAEVLLLILFGLAALNGIRMIGWYAPVFVAVVAPHIADIARRWLPAHMTAYTTSASGQTLAAAAEDSQDAEYELPPGQSFRYSVVALLLVWIAFALSPSSQIMFKKSRPPENLHTRQTPLQLTAFLNEAYDAEAAGDAALSPGQTFHPQWWGDWLKWDGPDQLRPFVTGNIHLAPPQVWRDYQRVIGMQNGWESILDRYDVKTVLVDRAEQPAMYRALSRSEDWSARYEDDQAAVFVRRPTTTSRRRSDDAANTTRIEETT